MDGADPSQEPQIPESLVQALQEQLRVDIENRFQAAFDNAMHNYSREIAQLRDQNQQLQAALAAGPLQTQHQATAAAPACPQPWTRLESRFRLPNTSMVKEQNSVGS